MASLEASVPESAVQQVEPAGMQSVYLEMGKAVYAFASDIHRDDSRNRSPMVVEK